MVAQCARSQAPQSSITIPTSSLQIWRLPNVDSYALGRKAATRAELELIRDDLPFDFWSVASRRFASGSVPSHHSVAQLQALQGSAGRMRAADIHGGGQESQVAWLPSCCRCSVCPRPPTLESHSNPRDAGMAGSSSALDLTARSTSRSVPTAMVGGD